MHRPRLTQATRSSVGPPPPLAPAHMISAAAAVSFHKRLAILAASSPQAATGKAYQNLGDVCFWPGATFAEVAKVVGYQRPNGRPSNATGVVLMSHSRSSRCDIAHPCVAPDRQTRDRSTSKSQPDLLFDLDQREEGRPNGDDQQAVHQGIPGLVPSMACSGGR